MKNTTYEFSTKGDTILNLYSQSEGFQWTQDCLSVQYDKNEEQSDEIQDSKGQAEEPTEGTTEAVNEDKASPNVDAPSNVDEPTNGSSGPIFPVADMTFGKISHAANGQVHYRMLASSAHLTQASPVFRRMLDGPYIEASTNERGFHKIEATDIDADALVIVLDIIHGHNRDVPRKLSLEMLAKVATVVDYYDCHEIVEVFAEGWLSRLGASFPETYGKDSMLCLFVCWIFSHEEGFQKMVELAMKYSEDLITVNGVPVPHDILSRINEERDKGLSNSFSVIYHLVSEFTQKDICSYECSSMLLGSLIKSLSTRGVYPQRPQKPFKGFSITSTADILANSPPLQWFSAKERGFGNKAHFCSVSNKLMPYIVKVSEKLHILRLDDFKTQDGQQKVAKP